MNKVKNDCLLNITLINQNDVNFRKVKDGYKRWFVINLNAFALATVKPIWSWNRIKNKCLLV